MSGTHYSTLSSAKKRTEKKKKKPPTERPTSQRIQVNTKLKIKTDQMNQQVFLKQSSRDFIPVKSSRCCAM